VPGEGFTEPSLAGKSGVAPLLLALSSTVGATGWAPDSRRCGEGTFSSAIACCHTAPIGNLGMRTQATRHFECRKPPRRVAGRLYR
jgi:hypothetical protein